MMATTIFTWLPMPIKQIMGYEMCDNLEASSTLKALKMALKNRRYKEQPLIHHSDRGLQYCSKIYTQCLIENHIAISMTEMATLMKMPQQKGPTAYLRMSSAYPNN